MNAGDAGDDVVEAFDVLDIERGPDVDAGREQVEHVEMALGVAAALAGVVGLVAVGEFVDQGQRRAAGEQGVEVHLLAGDAGAGEPAAGEDFETGEQGCGVGAAMGLDDAADDVASLGPARAGSGQHFPGLAEPGIESEEHRRDDGEVFCDVIGDGKRGQGATGHQQLLADANDLDELGRVAVEVDHVAGFAGGLGAGVHGDADIGLSQSGGVVGAVTAHRDEVAALLFGADQSELGLGGAEPGSHPPRRSWRRRGWWQPRARRSV